MARAGNAAIASYLRSSHRGESFLYLNLPRQQQSYQLDHLGGFCTIEPLANHTLCLTSKYMLHDSNDNARSNVLQICRAYYSTLVLNRRGVDYFLRLLAGLSIYAVLINPDPVNIYDIVSYEGKRAFSHIIPMTLDVALLLNITNSVFSIYVPSVPRRNLLENRGNDLYPACCTKAQLAPSARSYDVLANLQYESRPKTHPVRVHARRDQRGPVLPRV